MMQKIAVHVAFSIALAIHVLPISVRAAEELSILPNMVWATSLSDPKLELESKGAATTLEGGRIAIAIGYRPKGKLSGRQSIRLDVLDSSGKFEGSVELDRALPQPRLQRPSGDELHHQEVDAVLRGEVEDRRHAGMRQAGEDVRLLAKPLARRRVFQSTAREDLDRHVAIEMLVARLPDFTHPALANSLEEAVVGEGVAF